MSNDNNHHPERGVAAMPWYGWLLSGLAAVGLCGCGTTVHSAAPKAPVSSSRKPPEHSGSTDTVSVTISGSHSPTTITVPLRPLKATPQQSHELTTEIRQLNQLLQQLQQQ